MRGIRSLNYDVGGNGIHVSAAVVFRWSSDGVILRASLYIFSWSWGSLPINDSGTGAPGAGSWNSRIRWPVIVDIDVA